MDDRLTRLETEIGALKPSLAARLSALEAASVQPPPAAPKSWFARLLAWMGDESPKLIAAIVVVLISYKIKDSVDLALRRQQLQLDVTKQMEVHLEALADPANNAEQLERAALLLAVYGQPAVIPLLNETRYGGLRAPAAEKGLQFVALTDPEAICTILPRVLTSHTRQFNWDTHLRVIRLLGASDCRAARDVLQRYSAVLAHARATPGDTTYLELVADQPEPDALDQLQKALTKSLTLLDSKGVL